MENSTSGAFGLSGGLPFGLSGGLPLPNGLLRQYIPKKRRMETVTEEELTMIENRLNHRPRKRLGFKTPYEVFHA